MEKDAQKILKEQFATLPPVLQNAIQSSEWQEKIHEIGKAHDLHIDKMGKLEDETVLVMLGLEGTEDYTSNLERELEVSSGVAQKITEEVNEGVFLPIREELQKAESNKEAETGDEINGEAVSEMDAPQSRGGGVEKEEVVAPQRMDEYLSRKSGREAPIESSRPETKEVPENLPTGTKEKAGGGVKQESSGDFLNEKFGGTTYSEQEKVIVTDDEDESREEGEVKQKPHSGSDPYREPIE